MDGFRNRDAFDFARLYDPVPNFPPPTSVTSPPCPREYPIPTTPFGSSAPPEVEVHLHDILVADLR